MIRNNITEVAYNVQSTVDSKHNIPIDYKVTNENDSKAMGNMVQRAKSILRTNEFTVLYDKGFHTGSELKTAQDLVLKLLLRYPNCHPQVRLLIMIITMNTSFTTKNQTHTLVRRDRFYALMDHGTSSGQAAAA